MSTAVNIEITTKRELRNNWGELLLEEGERVTVTTIHCHNGPYTYKRADGSTRTVPRSWLVECGALEPMSKAASHPTGAGEGK